ncbi:methylmalonyl-CoA epimerase [uncultured Sphingomonas sp.]|uniref:methylmalonyl-CoA epimerase n=1 Tax=uncultured Sphingomonas sp. TaxID=158754 RepID=UPI0035CC2300
MTTFRSETAGTLGRLNHVGIATPSIARSVATYRTLLGATAIGEPFDVPAQGVRVCFVDAPNTQIELIEPLDDASPIAGFLRRNPAGGQHHVCFEVPDVHAAVADLKAKGATVLGEPRTGAPGTPTVFVDPRDMGGLLVELMEAPVGHAPA